MYSGVSSHVTSFLLNEQYGDCISILEQPTVRAFGITEFAKPPISSTSPKTNHQRSPSDSSAATSPLKLGLKDTFGNNISCPENTVPIARITLEKMTSFPTLREFFAKAPQNQSSSKQKRQLSEKASHLYAVGQQEVDNYGGSSFLNVWNPEGRFSASQQWYLGVSETTIQSIEGGWQVAPWMWGTTDPVLFIYWTADHYGNTGCYNHLCPSFVQTNNKYMLPHVLQPYSTVDNPGLGVSLEWQLYSGNWWLFINGESIGYYPTSIFNGGPLSKYSTVIQYGGEVVANSEGLSPPMGSGAFAQAGYGHAAYQNDIFYFNLNASTVWVDLQTLDQRSACYTIERGEQPNGGVWSSYIFFGGPGGSACTLE